MPQFEQFFDYEPNDPYYRIARVEYKETRLNAYVTFIDSDDLMRTYKNPSWPSMARLECIMNQMDIEIRFDEYLPIITAYRK